MVNDFLNGSNFSSHSLDPLISCWHNFTSRSSANIDSLLLFERNKFVHKKKMSQDTQTKKRNLDEISADSSSIEQADTGGGEPASKEVKPSLEEPEWLSALYQKMKTDKRIGFTKQQPSIPELNHGWLMEANKEVLHALIKPEFSKCISYNLCESLIIPNT